jgi:hypothetical protein
MASDLPIETIPAVTDVTATETSTYCSFDTVMNYVKDPVSYVNAKLVEADQAVITLAKPATDIVSNAVSKVTDFVQPATAVVTSTISEISTFVTTSPVRVVVVAAAAYATYCAYSNYNKSADKKSKN